MTLVVEGVVGSEEASAADAVVGLVIKVEGSTTMVRTDSAHRMATAVQEDTVLLVVGMVEVLEVLAVLVDMDLLVVGTAEEAAFAEASNVKMALLGMMIASSNVLGISFVLLSSFTATPFF
ncbi:hypothetical protein BDY19DRAFT_973795 [Irpex rosettiformis]|uniref:Uncharacterized protein n=1 Tax=Irpex rosettiformis TaxID=378272 RepID=A0ACB8TQM0_9APHY|nr:hypothetical protein BDY19DRAFT_973795 [Irpex rosettiformis]